MSAYKLFYTIFSYFWETNEYIVFIKFFLIPILIQFSRILCFIVCMKAMFDHKSVFLLMHASALRFLNLFSFHTFCDSFSSNLYQLKIYNQFKYFTPLKGSRRGRENRVGKLRGNLEMRVYTSCKLVYRLISCLRPRRMT